MSIIESAYSNEVAGVPDGDPFGGALIHLAADSVAGTDGTVYDAPIANVRDPDAFCFQRNPAAASNRSFVWYESGINGHPAFGLGTDGEVRLFEGPVAAPGSHYRVYAEEASSGGPGARRNSHFMAVVSGMATGSPNQRFIFYNSVRTIGQTASLPYYFNGGSQQINAGPNVIGGTFILEWSRNTSGLVELICNGDVVGSNTWTALWSYSDPNHAAFGKFAGVPWNAAMRMAEAVMWEDDVTGVDTTREHLAAKYGITLVS